MLLHNYDLKFLMEGLYFVRVGSVLLSGEEATQSTSI